MTVMTCPGCEPISLAVHPATYYELACDGHRAYLPDWSPAARAARLLDADDPAAALREERFRETFLGIL